MDVDLVFNSSFAFDRKGSTFDQTSKFVVFTGTTVSGKTSVLNGLGVAYEPEVARVYIERELAKGRCKEEIRSDEGEFQRGLVATKQEIEAAAPKQAPHFFDRALPDSITYYRAAGLDPSPVLACCFAVRYALILHFDPLPDSVVQSVMEHDPVRTEDPKTRALLDEWLFRDYTALGYTPVRVPVAPLKARIALVRQTLFEGELLEDR